MPWFRSLLHHAKVSITSSPCHRSLLHHAIVSITSSPCHSFNHFFTMLYFSTLLHHAIVSITSSPCHSFFSTPEGNGCKRFLGLFSTLDMGSLSTLDGIVNNAGWECAQRLIDYSQRWMGLLTMLDGPGLVRINSPTHLKAEATPSWLEKNAKWDFGV